jgi:hypothetical protein
MLDYAEKAFERQTGLFKPFVIWDKKFESIGLWGYIGKNSKNNLKIHLLDRVLLSHCDILLPS